MKLPVVHSIKSFSDATKALENIRNYFGNSAKAKGLVFVDGKGNYEHKDLGKDIQPAGVIVRGDTEVIEMSTTTYVRMIVQGHPVKFMVVKDEQNL